MKLKITPKQIRAIKIAQRQLGIDDDTYRDMLKSRFRVSSCTRLNRGQAGVLIDEWKRSGGFRAGGARKRKTRLQPSPKGYGPTGEAAPTRKRRPSKRRNNGLPNNVTRLATPAEHKKIKALAGLIAWEYDDGLSRWMQKRLEIDRVRTALDAWRTIEALKKMFEVKMTKRYGPDWWGVRFEDPKIVRYIGEHCPEEYR